MSAKQLQLIRNPAGDEDGGESVTGTVSRIIYRSEETGYTVCEVGTHDGRGTVTVVGKCAAVWEGEHLRAEGRWTEHGRHGRQFKAERIICTPPTSPDGIRRYLAGGMIDGVGEVMAERLVKAFGKDTLRIIEEESARLLDVPGIGPKRRAQIKSSWVAQKAVRDIMLFLQGHGIGTAQAWRICRHYGHDAPALVSRNPYILSRDIWGIGFRTADRIAGQMGVPRDSPLRARAAVVYVLEEAADEGHCFLTREQIVEAAAALDVPAERTDAALQEGLAAGELVEDGARVYLRPLHEAECRVARGIRRLLGAGTQPVLAAGADDAIRRAEQRAGVRFDPAQADAVRMALSRKVCIITGGPGVGKTTIVKAVVEIVRARGLKVALAAPTGKAAKRMEEATGCEARTIHRLLKYQPGGRQFEYGHGRPLEEDVFILDEVSMIDISLMGAVADALPARARLILVGDADQLPSVGPGNVLRDLVDSGAVPCCRLRTVFRQAGGSWIVHNAHRVNEGRFFELPPERPDALSDFYFIRADEPDDVLRAMLNLVTKRIPARFGFNPRADIQVLTPMRRNALGADNLNTLLQEALNPAPAAGERFPAFRAGDRVMQIRNNYDREVFNGDTGVVRLVDRAAKTATVDFDGRLVVYPLLEADELALAYACSIHKSQGSEYPAVVILLATQHYRLLQRNLLYTALTRGKRLVCLVGSRKAVEIAIRNNRTTERQTALRERLAAPAGAGDRADADDDGASGEEEDAPAQSARAGIGFPPS